MKTANSWRAFHYSVAVEKVAHYYQDRTWYLLCTLKSTKKS